MPDSAPKEFKELAQHCCDVDPDKRPDAKALYRSIANLYTEILRDESNNDVWDTIYHNDVRPLSRREKESKYSSTLLPTTTGDFYDSVAGTKITIDYINMV